ncbi:unnamed protein product [Discula destructiva]
MSTPGISVAIFSPQSSCPSSSYLAHVRSRLLGDGFLISLRETITSGLLETWDTFASSRQDTIYLKDARQRIQSLADWLKTGNSDAIESDKSGLITLPLLVTVHIVQYLDFLRQSSISHSQFLESLKIGGSIQGYCMGLLSAIVVASSNHEQTLVERAAMGMRLSVIIGAFGDLAAVLSNVGWNTLALRLRHGSQEEEAALLAAFPRTYISTISDSHSRSLIVPDDQLGALLAYAEIEGLQSKRLHISSKLHDPNNATLAEECVEWCEEHMGALKYALSESLRVSVRSNRNGQELCGVTHSVIRQVAETILVFSCDWSQVVHQVASELQQRHQGHHNIALFGIGNTISLAPFRQLELDITKLDMLSGTTGAAYANTPSAVLAAPESKPSNGVDSYLADAIAIVGAGCRLPGASSLDQLWDLISEGESRLEPLRSERANLQQSFRADQDRDWVNKRKFFGNYVDDVDSFDHAFFGISPREAKYMDPQQRLLLATAFDAMDSSGYLRHHGTKPPKGGLGDPVGCFIGASYSEYCENTSAHSPTAFTATGTIRAFLSGKISYHFGWSGPSEVIDTACSASIVAIHRACQAIRTGECTMALAGGVNLITGINNYLDLGKASFLSPTGQCKPFDDSADGYCRADGVGLVVLKPLAQAAMDGDHIMGVIQAVATNQGGMDAPGITVPDGTAQKDLYQRLLQKSGVSADQVTYVEAHGTGTQVGDPIEIKSVRDVFGSPMRAGLLHLGSLKANIGHSETAAGVASVLKVLAMLRHKGIPPLQGFRELNHKIPSLDSDRICIPRSLQPWVATPHPRSACINSYGASGSNSALLLSEWRNSPRIIQAVSQQYGKAYPILLSANSTESLQRYSKDLASHIRRSLVVGGDDCTLGNLAFTLSERRKHHKIRWATTATSLTDLARELQNLTTDEPAKVSEKAKHVVLAFCGQSRTTIGLDPSVRHNYPRFEEYIVECNDILMALGCPSILPALLEPSQILDPVTLQCGTVAVQYACAKCWIDGGLQVDAVVGHSLGELTALAVSGVLSLADALRVVYTRATSINEKWGPERGSMLAVHAPLEVVQSVMGDLNCIESEEDQVEIACYNSLSSHVLVATEAGISKVDAQFRENSQYQGIRYSSVDVSHGFHSRFTEPLLQDLADLGRTVIFRKPTIPIETCTTTPLEFGKDPSVNHSGYIATHAREPVYFSDAVLRLERRLGPCVWLEAGWGSPIIAMTKKAVAEPKIHSFHAVTGSAATVADLWRQGISIANWGFLTPKTTHLTPIWLPPYSFDSPKAWIDHFDHAAEEKKKVAELRDQIASIGSNSGGITSSNAVCQLVSHKGSTSGPNGSSDEFRLHTTTERFMRISKGHAVRGKPLCPASVYMEAAVMGISQLGVDFTGQSITVQNVVFPRPLGCNENLDVELCLARQSPEPRSTAESQQWHYSVRSASNKSVYSEGDLSISISSHADLDLYASLITDSIEAVKNDPNAEKLLKNTAYALFSKTVEYADLMRGITRITMQNNNKAWAQIEVPESPFSTVAPESTVSAFFDAISLDTFVQVLGLLVNCNNGSGDEIYIASCVGKLVISPTDYRKARKWTVYATYSSLDPDDTVLNGSIFVFSEAGKMVAFGTKIQFHKTKASKLERVLEAASGKKTQPSAAIKPTALTPLPQSHRSVSHSDVSFPPTPKAETEDHLEHQLHLSPSSVALAIIEPVQEDQGSKIKELKSLIAAYSGLKESEVRDDMSFADMGLDSLGCMELASELESTMDVYINPEDLLTGSIRSLVKAFPVFGSQFTGAANSHPVSPSLDALPQKSGAWTRPVNPIDARFKIDTMSYKDLDTLSIPADVYIPLVHPPLPMPIAVMIHGGGHLTLSRRAVRPDQTKFLLSLGILPISIDYRMAPHINVLDGSMTDARDACIWAKRELPEILARKHGLTVDPTKLVVVGWSTGGTLAMTTSWTLPGLGVEPPLAVLSFYCPVDYNPDAPIIMGQGCESRTMSLRQIEDTLPSGPVTSHAPNSLDTTKLGWLKHGDPRSELVLALVKEHNGMSLLFNDWPLKRSEQDGGDRLPCANAARAAAFSPFANLRNGSYGRTPTYMIFGDEDEIAPYGRALEFERALRNGGISGGFLTVKGAKHIFDLGLAPGSVGWQEGIGPGYEFLIDQIERAYIV